MSNTCFSNEFHSIAYCINRNSLINDLREQLKELGKQLSIGEIDKNIYITVLYNSTIDMMKIPDKCIFPVKIHEIYCMIHDSFLSEKSEYDSDCKYD